MSPRSRTRVPTYRRHRATGQAVVTLNGRDHYLGPHGTERSRERYEQLIAEYLSNGRRLTLRDDDASLTVTELVAAYWPFVEQHYRKGGRPTSEVANIRLALRPLKRLYGTTPAAAFSPKRLKAVREDMITRALSRGVINQQVGKIRRMFKWAVSEELVDPSVLQGLQAVTGLKSGRTRARETEPVRPVPDADVEAVMPHLPRPVAAIVEVMRVTGARVGEVVEMRTADLDRSADVWIFRPRRHKTQHFGRERAIPLGPRAQAALRPFLKADPDAFMLSPQDAQVERSAERREARRTPMTPSQRRRERDQDPLNGRAEVYTTCGVRKAVTRACKAARVEHWHPHQLRHTVGTRLRALYGLDAARALLGHSSPAITAHYAEVDLAKGVEVARAVG